MKIPINITAVNIQINQDSNEDWLGCDPRALPRNRRAGFVYFFKSKKESTTVPPNSNQDPRIYPEPGKGNDQRYFWALLLNIFVK